MPRAIARAAVVTHGKPDQIGAGLARLQAVAHEHGVELLFTSEESEKHEIETSADTAGAETRVTSRINPIRFMAFPRQCTSGRTRRGKIADFARRVNRGLRLRKRKNYFPHSR